MHEQFSAFIYADVFNQSALVNKKNMHTIMVQLTVGGKGNVCHAVAYMKYKS